MNLNKQIPEEETWEVFSSIEEIFEIDDTFGKYGFKDKDGNIVIKPQYSSCLGEFHQGLCAVALATWYTSQEGRELYQMHWGYIDKYGEVVIPFIYNEVSSFNRYGVAVVSGDEQYRHLINTKGEKIKEALKLEFADTFEPDNRYIEFWEDDSEADMPNTTGLYDTKEHRIVYPAIAKGFLEYNEELVLVYTATDTDYDWVQHYINSKGESAFPWLENGYFKVEKPDSHGNAIVGRSEYIETPDAKSFYFSIDDKKYKRMIRYGVAGKDGELTPCIYDSIKKLNENEYQCTLKEEITTIKINNSK